MNLMNMHKLSKKIMCYSIGSHYIQHHFVILLSKTFLQCMYVGELFRVSIQHKSIFIHVKCQERTKSRKDGK